MTSTASTLRRSTASIDPVRWAAAALAGAYALLYTELFLTADAESPNTWVGLISDTAVLAVAGALALSLAAMARSGRWGNGAAITCLVLTVLFSLPFWTGSAIVLGMTTYALNHPRRRSLAIIGVALAAVSALFLLVDLVVSFAPGLPS